MNEDLRVALVTFGTVIPAVLTLMFYHKQLGLGIDIFLILYCCFLFVIPGVLVQDKKRLAKEDTERKQYEYLHSKYHNLTSDERVKLSQTTVEKEGISK